MSDEPEEKWLVWSFVAFIIASNLLAWYPWLDAKRAIAWFRNCGGNCVLNWLEQLRLLGDKDHYLRKDYWRNLSRAALNSSISSITTPWPLL
jgi:hypothetical protein